MLDNPFNTDAQEMKLGDIQRKFLESAEYAYHITKERNLPSIMEKGLLPNTMTGECNFHSLSRAGVVYFMTDRAMTLRMGRYIERGEMVLIKIKKEKLDVSKISDDTNLDYNSSESESGGKDRWRCSMCYHGVIPPEAFEKVEKVDTSNVTF